MQSPYIAAALSHARAQDIERSPRKTGSDGAPRARARATELPGRPGIRLEQAGRQAGPGSTPSYIHEQRTRGRSRLALNDAGVLVLGEANDDS